MIIITRKTLPIRLLLTPSYGIKVAVRQISSKNSNDKVIDDNLINQWKEGIQKREELQKTLAKEEHDNFIETKKKQLEESHQNVELLEKAVQNQRKVSDLGKTDQDDLKVSGSYQQLVKKIKENENFQQLKQELKKYGENHHQHQNDAEDQQQKHPQDKSYREHLSDRLKHNAEELKNAFPIVLRIINELTGYTKVENLKQDIMEKEAAKQKLKLELAKAKTAYNKSIELRSMSQKQINELLQRQNSWSLQDLERFTELYKNDHILEKQEHENFQIMQDLEAKKDENDEKLTTSILTRYHEEQIWSDKIRKFSTWGTILIMGVNLVLFVVVQLLFEPLKRRRLVNAFEIKVKEMLENNNNTGSPTTTTVASPIVAETVGIKPLSTPEQQKQQQKETDIVSFHLPPFDKHNIKIFILQLYDNLKDNIHKFFSTSSSALVIDKFQFNVLLGLSVLTSFSLGLVF